MIDISSIKPGDKVTVHGVVTAARSGSLDVEPDKDIRPTGAHWRIFAHPEDIVSHTPAPREIEVGDRVMRDVPGMRAEAEVIGIHRTQAWLLVAHGEAGFITEVADVARLRHAPPPR